MGVAVNEIHARRKRRAKKDSEQPVKRKEPVENMKSDKRSWKEESYSASLQQLNAQELLCKWRTLALWSKKAELQLKYEAAEAKNQRAISMGSTNQI